MMRFVSIVLTILLLALGGCSTPTPVPPEVRPVHWAQKVDGAHIRNFWQVAPDLYRSSYPSGAQDINDLCNVGIETVINLRAHTESEKEILHGDFITHRYKMNAGSVSCDGLRTVLRLILDSPKPVLVHCWHGSDRTGFIIAGYRIVCQGWDKEEAIREMRLGGFNFHDYYTTIADTLRTIDVTAMRHELGLKVPLEGERSHESVIVDVD